MNLVNNMNVLRDAAGIPAHPLIFQILMIFTWIFHIAFVHLTLGAASLSIYGFHLRHLNTHWERLSIALTKVAKVSISLLIVLGVAPLLFTQVIYDPQWYVSNLLSGRWAISFIFTLIIAYCLWFAFYYANKTGAKRNISWFAWLALALLCLDGLIMHSLSYQALLPDKWMDWYAPNSIVDMRGARLHAIQWPRYLFIMSLAVPVVGAFLMSYVGYFKARPDYTAEYLDFVQRLGRLLFVMGIALSLVLFIAWQLILPAELNLHYHPLPLLMMGLMTALALIPARWSERLNGHVPLFAMFIVLALLATWREIIRIHSLRPFGYTIDNYPVHADIPSTVLFFLTFIGVGGLVGGFYLSLLYRAGRVQGQYQADRRMSRLGTAAVTVLALWIATFFIYGIVIFVRNSFVA